MVPEQDSRNARAVEKRASERKPESPAAQLKAGKDAGEQAPGLGRTFAEARKSRGLSPEDGARQARIPGHYLRMIESDNYERISDQLYLLPFLRRYAVFLKLDPEEVTGRFLHEVQRADSFAIKIAEPILVAEPASMKTWIAAAVGAGLTIVAIALTFFALSLRKTTPPAQPAAPAAAESPASGAPASVPAAAAGAAQSR